MFLEPRSVLMSEADGPATVDSDVTANGCDCVSYMYFSLSFILFATGSVLTLVILEDDDFGPLSRFWLVGPLFLCLGFLIAIKTLVYLRRKRFIAFILRQRHFAQEFNQPGLNPWCNLTTTPSQMSLPPSYEATVDASSAATAVMANSVPSPPPSYQQALLNEGANGIKLTPTSSLKFDGT